MQSSAKKMRVSVVGCDAQRAIDELGGLGQSPRFLQDKAEIDQGGRIQGI
jgi:hypothetical protein